MTVDVALPHHSRPSHSIIDRDTLMDVSGRWVVYSLPTAVRHTIGGPAAIVMGYHHPLGKHY
jgi:hypothetical protein